MTAKLTDMQLVLLATACQREDGSLLPPAAILGPQGGRIHRAVAALIKRALAAECDIADKTKAWRQDGDRHIGVVITDAGRGVIAAETPEASDGTTVSQAAPVAAPDQPAAPADAPARTGTKQALVLNLLHRDGGANMAELVAATGWLPHTMRAALTGLRKKGHAIDKAKRDDVTVYYIAAAA